LIRRRRVKLAVKGLVVNVVYSSTKPIVNAAKPVLEAAALPESVEAAG